MEKIAILFNPSSNRGKSLKALKNLKKFFENQNLKFELFLSKNVEDFKNLSLKLSNDYEILSIAGGDSSYTIAIDYILKNKREGLPIFSFIPTGSSNDIPREFNILNLKDAANSLKRMNHRKMDVGYIMIEDKIANYFLGQVNIGMGAEVNMEVEKMKKSKFPLKNQKLMGFTSVVRTYKKGNRAKSLKIKKTNESELNGKFLISLFSNIKYWVTGKKVLPVAEIDDGILDLMIVNDINFLKLLKLYSKLKKEEHLNDKDIITDKSKTFEIEGEEPFSIQYDGEILFNNNSSLFYKVKIGVLKNRIKVLTNI